ERAEVEHRLFGQRPCESKVVAHGAQETDWTARKRQTGRRARDGLDGAQETDWTARKRQAGQRARDRLDTSSTQALMWFFTALPPDVRRGYAPPEALKKEGG
ncbi:MAG TPA: hypothetical protein VFP64_12360, partial [Pyrinomonadaceae bacterium]|nr:hypothetical protein [Pyrinomonadaceae bacterium]